jgi:hypothetical protein
MSRIRIGLAVVVLALSASSCAPVQTQDRSLLKPAEMSPDSVVLDIFFVRFPFGDEQINRQLWKEVDEQHFTTEVRRELLRNGFRAGVVGTQLPTELAELLELTDEPAQSLEASEICLAELESDPAVTRRHSQCRAGGRMEIAASPIHDELPVMVSEEQGLCGKSYPRAQGMLAVTPFPEPDGRVRLEVVPELHFGQTRQRPVATQCGFRLEVRRPREVFDKLAFSANLNPGHMIVVSCLPDRPGSLGHHFLTEVSSGQKEQKLLVVRLSQTQHDDLSPPTDVISLDALDQ